MDLGLRDKVAIVTGAASGLGLCTAELLYEEGCRLVMADVNATALAEAAARLDDPGRRAVAVVTDVRSYEACQDMVARAIEAFGHVDILVNSAGIGGPLAFFADTEPSDWRDLIDVNLIGVMNCCRAVVGHMIERRYGKIVSMASEAGKGNEKRLVVYGTTKGGVISLMRGLAVELGRFNINVNAVCPGVTHTPMTSYLTEEIEQAAIKHYPLGRLGEPEDIAPLVAFLASDRASWITGQAISVNGGFGRA